MGRVKERTPELRRHVVAVATAVLEEEGVAAFTARRVAAGAGTSIPAVYELFGDKAGLTRAVLFEGFAMLAGELDSLPARNDPVADLVEVLGSMRRFVAGHPALAAVMFLRPVADFDPGPEEAAAAKVVRACLVARVRRCIEAGVLSGNPTDVAHILLALVQGLAGQEGAGWLGTSRASVERRWSLGIHALLAGLAQP